MIRVQKDDFDVSEEIRNLTHGNLEIGGVSSFVGLVRQSVGTEKITELTLEHYPGMTEKALQKIEAEALERWPLNGSLIIHRFGCLAPGEQIVLVCVTSAHRQAAIEACSFLIDWLKTDAPFWKREETAGGGRWVDARQLDLEQKQRWNTTK